MQIKYRDRLAQTLLEIQGQVAQDMIQGSNDDLLESYNEVTCLFASLFTGRDDPKPASPIGEQMGFGAIKAQREDNGGR